MLASLASRPLAAFPVITGGSASALPFSRPAQRSLEIAACALAEPSKTVLWHRSASIHVVTSINRSDCFRLERQLAGAGSAPAGRHRLSTAHASDSFSGTRKFGNRLWHYASSAVGKRWMGIDWQASTRRSPPQRGQTARQTGSRASWRTSPSDESPAAAAPRHSALPAHHALRAASHHEMLALEPRGLLQTLQVSHQAPHSVSIPRSAMRRRNSSRNTGARKERNTCPRLAASVR